LAEIRWRARRAERREGRAHRVSGARQRSGGVEKYSSIASRQAPEHGSTAILSGGGLEDQRHFDGGLFD
jgi:hypothetical protein